MTPKLNLGILLILSLFIFNCSSKKCLSDKSKVYRGKVWLKATKEEPVGLIKLSGSSKAVLYSLNHTDTLQKNESVLFNISYCPDADFAKNVEINRGQPIPVTQEYRQIKLDLHNQFFHPNRSAHRLGHVTVPPSQNSYRIDNQEYYLLVIREATGVNNSTFEEKYYLIHASKLALFTELHQTGHTFYFDKIGAAINTSMIPPAMRRANMPSQIRVLEEILLDHAH